MMGKVETGFYSAEGGVVLGTFHAAGTDQVMGRKTWTNFIILGFNFPFHLSTALKSGQWGVILMTFYILSISSSDVG